MQPLLRKNTKIYMNINTYIHYNHMHKHTYVFVKILVILLDTTYKHTYLNTFKFFEKFGGNLKLRRDG